MKKAIVFSSGTGNTKKLAEVIRERIGENIYYGTLSEEALEADFIYVGSWTQAFTCPTNVKEFLEKINNKKVFVFMTAGYGSSSEYLEPIINSVKEHINDTNEIIGEFICQGKVSDFKRDAIKKMDMEKYKNMKAELDKSQAHPDEADIKQLSAVLKGFL